MIRIVIVVKPDCVACDIVKKVVLKAIQKIDTEITLNVCKNNDENIATHKVKVFPTTIFYKYDKDCHTCNGYTVGGQGWLEIARLKGSFPIDYLNRVIDKIKTEYNE